ncbi:MAG: hypothetical protein JST80_08865 [Bdellovibrionales bacterium]|nr:hypothetical protein [Bdellovibrionales bacterium]
MKPLFAALVTAITILGTTVAYAKDPKPTCSVTVKNGWHNIGIKITDAITLADCIARAQSLLTTPYNDNQLAMNPFNRKATVKYFKVIFATAKIKYDSIDGTSKTTLTNDNASIEQTGKKVVYLGSDFIKCWKNGGDCAPLQDL